jgi:hypothetical protein
MIQRAGDDAVAALALRLASPATVDDEVEAVVVSLSVE